MLLQRVPARAPVGSRFIKGRASLDYRGSISLDRRGSREGNNRLEQKIPSDEEIFVLKVCDLG
jgi:hypothetical protein